MLLAYWWNWSDAAEQAMELVNVPAVGLMVPSTAQTVRGNHLRVGAVFLHEGPDAQQCKEKVLTPVWGVSVSSQSVPPTADAVVIWLAYSPQWVPSNWAKAISGGHWNCHLQSVVMMKGHSSPAIQNATDWVPMSVSGTLSGHPISGSMQDRCACFLDMVGRDRRYPHGHDRIGHKVAETVRLCSCLARLSVVSDVFQHLAHQDGHASSWRWASANWQEWTVN